SDGTGFPFGGRPRIGTHLMRGLRHAVRFEDGRAEYALHPFHHFGWKRGAARTNEAQSLGTRGALVTRSSEKKIVDCGYGRIPGCARVPHSAPERERAELLGNHNRAARGKRGESGGDESVD